MINCLSILRPILELRLKYPIVSKVIEILIDNYVKYTLINWSSRKVYYSKVYYFSSFIDSQNPLKRILISKYVFPWDQSYDRNIKIVLIFIQFSNTKNFTYLGIDFQYKQHFSRIIWYNGFISFKIKSNENIM